MRLFLIAGEASGDALGAALMEGLAPLTDAHFDGIGGPKMQAQGLTSRFPMETLSVMGIAEVLPRYFDLKRRIRQCADWVIETKPDALITIDSPDFCLRVAKLVKQRSAIPTIHYVAPSVWAWRPGRAAKMARHIDHVLALLPFEPPYMQAAGMSCDFVGHPIAARPKPAPDPALKARFGERVLCLLPGSRASEIARLGPTFAEVARRTGAATVIPAAPGRDADVQALAADIPGATVIASDDPLDRLTLFASCDGALAASGTVSLELAAAGCPMVIAYDMAWLSRQIMTRMALIDTVTLVNLITDTRTIPEFIGPACTPDQITPALTRVLAGDHDQSGPMDAALTALGRGGPPPGRRAALSVLEHLGGSPPG